MQTSLTQNKKGKSMTFEQETAMTIFAPALAIPLASDLDPTYTPKQN